MKVVLFLCVVFVALVAATTRAPFLNGDSLERVHGEYIVVLHNDVDLDAHVNRMSSLWDLVKGNRFLHAGSFHIGDSFQGYTAALTDEMLNRVLIDPEVKYVEANAMVHAYEGCTTQRSVLWNLDRVSERASDLDGLFDYPESAGAGVTVYVIDTGIYIEHDEFSGRATWGWSFDNQNVDGNGHGTHVAGSVGGTLYGVAKKTSLVAVKVLGANGSGTIAGVVNGVNWVANNKKQPSVANMSLGGGRSTALVDSVEAAIAAGTPFAVAAGNDNNNACNYSPANAPNAITVGATTSSDARSVFSNWGTCVDVSAPGTTITAAWIGSRNAVRTISGTSMASPHVAAAAALILGQDGSLSPAAVTARVTSTATPNVISDIRTSPNLLVYVKYCD